MSNVLPQLPSAPPKQPPQGAGNRLLNLVAVSLALVVIGVLGISGAQSWWKDRQARLAIEPDKEAPKKARPPAPPTFDTNDVRRNWVAAQDAGAWGSAYRHGGNAQWSLDYANGVSKRFLQKSFSDRFIELASIDEPDYLVRLFSDHLETKLRDAQWQRGEAGDWRETDAGPPHPPVAISQIPFDLIGLYWPALTTSGRFEQQVQSGPPVVGRGWIASGWLAGSQVPDRVELPLQFVHDYVLDLRFVRHAGDQGLTLELPGERGTFRLALNGETASADEEANDALQFPTGVEQHLRCVVDPQGAAVTLNGKPLFEDPVPANRLQVRREAANAGMRLALEVKQSSCEVTQLTIVRKEASTGEPAAMPVLPMLPALARLGRPLSLIDGNKSRATATGNLLAAYQAKNCCQDGQITVGGAGEWVLHPSATRASMAVFPDLLPGEYELKAVFRRDKHPIFRDAIVFVLPVGERHALVLLNAYSGQGFLGGIEVGPAPLFQTSALARRVFLQPNTDYTARCLVRSGSVKVLLNDEEIAHWEGDSQSLAPNPFWLRAAPHQLGVSGWQTQYTLNSLQVSPLPATEVETTAGL